MRQVLVPVIGTVGVILKLESGLQCLATSVGNRMHRSRADMNAAERVDREVDLCQLWAKLEAGCIRLRRREYREERKEMHAIETSQILIVREASMSSQLKRADYSQLS